MTAHPKSVLITGAARRIGREIALDLARNGWRVAVHYRSSGAEAHALVAHIQSTGGDAVALDADLDSHEAVAALVPRCAAALGAPVCLVNNASAFFPDSVGSLSQDRWNAHLRANLEAPVFLAEALAQALPEGQSGNVINIIDQRVWHPTPEFFSYTVSKAGLWTATRMLAQALAPRVRVNAIGPGPVLQSVYQTAEAFADECRRTLLGHGPSPGEIAAAVRFILATPSLTGQMITLDGGQHLAWTAAPGTPPGTDPITP